MMIDEQRFLRNEDSICNAKTLVFFAGEDVECLATADAVLGNGNFV